MVRALVLERQHELALRDIDLPQDVGPGEVKIAIHTVGVCGSDVHYYTHGRIGPFVVNHPMVLGHEASGTIVEVGEGVRHLKAGDRVCMEPGIPDPTSKASRLGMYNIDPSVRFWATPPIHGVLTPYVVHPADFTFRLPDNVSFAEGAMIEPFAVGMQAAAKARITPGDTAVVIGAGPIGTMVAIAALAGGCARVIVADLVFECSGSPKAWETILDLPCPGGRIVAVGLPVDPVPIDISTASTREIGIETVFRYAHQYERSIALMASGKVDLKPLISETFDFKDSVKAFERAAEGRPADVKLQIVLTH